ncbi:hypothetical protein [Burkholderia lata]|uniref:Uncharacterized protein n=1 Tax=Burkholderia lata (strain ATCC 17760 / DSM 23089 / LMG 22485 / NCIMB 9086 / R18194 / 383) TaxID=482957 RepID=A0A6P2GTS0_BURL3|nr:hypothetical protein [Burkholderia lata]VWB07926.1 hypothetical protein BLA6863_00192 [Burkholderia lata]
MSHAPYQENELNGGTQKLYRFDNGFGARVVQHQYSYGGDMGQWELAVIKFNGDKWDLTYETDITFDVLGYLDWHEVAQYLDQIAALQSA